MFKDSRLAAFLAKHNLNVSVGGEPNGSLRMPQSEHGIIKMHMAKQNAHGPGSTFEYENDLLIYYAGLLTVVRVFNRLKTILHTVVYILNCNATKE